VKALKILLLIILLSSLAINTFACQSEAEKYLQEAVAFMEQGEDFQAIKALEKTKGIEPDNADFFIRRADFYFKSGYVEDAIADYNEAIRLKPDATLYTKRGRSYMRMSMIEMSDFDNAIEDFNEAIRLDPLLAEAWVWRGKVYHTLGQLELFREAHYYHALSQEALAQYEVALEDITMAMRLEPDAGYQGARALVYIDMEEYEKAIADYDEAILFKPTASNYGYRSQLHFAMGQHEQAIEDLNEAIRLDPTISGYYHTRGTMYSILGQYENAINDFNESIQLDPRYIWAYQARGFIYVLLGNYEKAIEDLTEALELFPEGFTYILRASAYIELGKYDEAADDYNEAIRRNPELTDHDKWLADYNKLNDYTKSVMYPGYGFNYDQVPAIIEKVRQAIEEYSQ